MPRKIDATKIRPPRLALPRWWLESLEVRRAGLSDQKLVEAINAATSKRPGWDRTTVGHALRSSEATMEMIQAVCQTFPDLPPPWFMAR